MRLALILATVGICGLGYTLYSSVFGSKYAEARRLQRIENSLDELVEHIDAYTQYYERRTWECHTAMQMTEQCMALPEGEQRALLREEMKRYVKEFNAYLDTMKPFCKQELDKAWNIALELKNMELHNPEQAALFSQCWENMKPYLVEEGYTDEALPSEAKDRAQIITQTRKNIIKRREEYAQSHKELLQWEQDYAYNKSEEIMATAELATAKLDMEAADHALALLLAENREEAAINHALEQAAEQAALLKEAEQYAARVEQQRMELETARLDMHHVDHIVEQNNFDARFEQVLIDHHQPGEELHPNLPRGARVVPGNDHQPPPTGGGWWSGFVQWVLSWIF